MNPTLIPADATVLFQGDSITDRGRSRTDDAQLGSGYAMMAAAWFSALHPEVNATFLNRGNSGNRTKDLVERWERDCLDLEPDVLSILIGINNTWRRYDNDDPTPVDRFEAEYHTLLEQVSSRLNVRLILLDPFVVPVPEDRRTWREDIDAKIEVVQRLAQTFGAVHVPLDRLFAQACERREPAYWASDGVHPTNAGHAFIAQAWLRAVCAIG